ncbi:MAG: YifB family Mg chelatase-like AAA ATPase [Selenomonadaceae bacterium]|nr:YifB family Mg chelatase-like AAA ATPase [Selenomonadaceae bacterium]
MYAGTFGATTQGVDGLIIKVEVDSANGMPSFDIVGLPNASVRESKERVRTAIKNSGLRMKSEKITINLAPADVKKESAGLDLPIALGILAAQGRVSSTTCKEFLFVAELSLEGKLCHVNGVLPVAVTARGNGFKKIVVSKENVNEALLVDDLEVYAPENLLELVDFLNGEKILDAEKPSPIQADENFIEVADDFADVQGQFMAKRALEIAAAGGHNVLMVGVPGSGKTMLSKRMNSILPELTREEALEVTKIYSIAGKLEKNSGLVRVRPFQNPNHDASAAAIIGGGANPKPGQVTLAHHGVLFLDELPEFKRSVIEALREPLEERKITVSRVNATLTFPSSVILICAMNPCPCGWRGDRDHACKCSEAEIRRYMRKLSGPLLDRIDIHIRVPRVKYEDLSSKRRAEPSSEIRKRVSAARQIQIERLKQYNLFCNAQMNHAMIKILCTMTDKAEQLLRDVFETKKLSARSYDRIIKVGRTIADLDGGAELISDKHIAEAIKLRNDLDFDVRS